MNTTTARAEVRSRIADAVPGIFTDAQVDAALSVAFSLVGPRFPVRVDRTVPVAAGALSIAGAFGTAVYVATPDADLPRANAPMTVADRSRALAWRPDGVGRVRLSRPVLGDEAGSWTVTEVLPPTFPAIPTATWELPAGPDRAVIVHAAAGLLRTRMSDDLKRGQRSSYTHLRLAADMEREARAIVEAYGRAARMVR